MQKNTQAGAPAQAGATGAAGSAATPGEGLGADAKPESKKERVLAKNKAAAQADSAAKALGARLVFAPETKRQPVELTLADVYRLKLAPGKLYEGTPIKLIVASVECWRVARGRAIVGARGTLKAGTVLTERDLLRRGEPSIESAARFEQLKQTALEKVAVGENLIVNYPDRVRGLGGR